MLDGRALPSSPAFLACMLRMPITFFPLVPTRQSAIVTNEDTTLEEKRRKDKGCNPRVGGDKAPAW
jgi:hypothetical protein